MNPKKQKDKSRRRARKLAAEGWEAVDAGNLDLAEKLLRRAVETQADNPVLWNDLGVVLGLRQKVTEAVESFRAALSLATNYASPYDHLAALRVRQGAVKEAVALQSQAVRWAPDHASYRERLAAYQALAGETDLQAAGSEPEQLLVTTADESIDLLQQRLDDLDWHRLGEQLTRDGYVLIAELVDASTCGRLRALFDDDALFAKTVVMDRPGFGNGSYRYFRAPIPLVVDQLRQAVYRFVAPIANSWQRLLGEPECYQSTWAEFQTVCHDAGQSTPTPILLKYGPSGFNELHRDLRGRVFFPIQMAVVLSQLHTPGGCPSDGFEGGEFLFCDVAEGRKDRRREVPASLGDALLFCTRDRLLRVGGDYGLQPVKHGAATITAGTRFVLGVPFHEYR